MQMRSRSWGCWLTMCDGAQLRSRFDRDAGARICGTDVKTLILHFSANHDHMRLSSSYYIVGCLVSLAMNLSTRHQCRDNAPFSSPDHHVHLKTPPLTINVSPSHQASGGTATPSYPHRGRLRRTSLYGTCSAQSPVRKQGLQLNIFQSKGNEWQGEAPIELSALDLITVDERGGITFFE